MNTIQFAFFGQDDFSVIILQELQKAGFTPSIIVTGPDKPVGRKQIITPPPVKQWATQNGIQVMQPEKLTEVFTASLEEKGPWDVFIVASYGKLLPQQLIDLPTRGTLNVHPSLLPRLRGADPIRTAILEEPHTGVSIMQLDKQMDHGPILAKQQVIFNEWPVDFFTLRDRLATLGGKLLAENLIPWINNDIQAVPQNHSVATYTKKVAKEDGEINIESGDPIVNWRKYLAFLSWPGTYFYTSQGIRLKVTEACLENGIFVVKKVIPEGKKEMLYDDYLRGITS